MLADVEQVEADRVAARASGWIGHPLALLCALALSTLLARLFFFGQPILNLDDQFYLLVGDAMLDGALPYVDVWDRKPPGLFALYALIRMLGGTGVWQMHVVAAASIVATAWVIHRLALRVSAGPGALLAAFAYTWWSALVGGGTGQSPVFFNLLMACAALLVIHLLEDKAASPARQLGRGMAAMALAGIALQIKPSTAIEIAFFGLTMLVVFWRMRGPFAAIAMAGLCAIVLFLPTMLAAWIWQARGEFDALYFAAVTSVSLRLPMPSGEFVYRLVTSAAMIAPLVLFAIAGYRLAGPASAQPVRRFLGIWLLVSIASLAAYGGFFSDHYVMPVLIPGCICAAAAWDRWRRLRYPIAATAFALATANFAIQWSDRHDSGQWQTLATLDALTEGQRNCPYLHDGPPVAVVVNDWCLVTPWAFTGHLTFELEREGLGVDPMEEVARVLATRPDRIIIRDDLTPNINLDTRAQMFATIRRDYLLAGHVEPDGLLVYALKPGREPLPNALPLHGKGIPPDLRQAAR